jgi:hypothetical protein
LLRRAAEAGPLCCILPCGIEKGKQDDNSWLNPIRIPISSWHDRIIRKIHI